MHKSNQINTHDSYEIMKRIHQNSSVIVDSNLYYETYDFNMHVPISNSTI